MKTYLQINEEQAVTQFISRIKNELGNDLSSIHLFGSKVRGDFDQDSDIDILIIVKTNKSELFDKIVDAQVESSLKYDANLSPVIFSEEEFLKNKEMGSPFVKNIEREGILL